jgi:uncharacterized YigZ family protein
MGSYNTIEKEGTAEFKDRGSKFLAYCFPFPDKADLKKHINALKKLHPKAGHFCFAYRIGTDGNNFRSSDDGEPAGSAGKPILGQIDSKGLTDVLVVVVRYFGGTLLGVPGLINAYKSVASFALQVTPTVTKPILSHIQIQLDYTLINEVLQVIKQYGGVIISQENQLFSVIKAGIPKERETEILYKLKNLRNVEISTLL